MTKTKCKIEDCPTATLTARGLCAKHYKRWQRHGHNYSSYTDNNHMCHIPGCERKANIKHLCTKHYKSTYEKEGTRCDEPGCTRGVYCKNKCRTHYCNQLCRERTKMLQRLKRCILGDTPLDKDLKKALKSLLFESVSNRNDT